MCKQMLREPRGTRGKEAMETMETVQTIWKMEGGHGMQYVLKVMFYPSSRCDEYRLVNSPNQSLQWILFGYSESVGIMMKNMGAMRAMENMQTTKPMQIMETEEAIETMDTYGDHGCDVKESMEAMDASVTLEAKETMQTMEDSRSHVHLSFAYFLLLHMEAYCVGFHGVHTYDLDTTGAGASGMGIKGKG